MKDITTVSVWDPLVRFFHWVLVAAFSIAYLSGEDFLTLHSWAGYLILGLLTIRIVWGFIGTRHARFSDFVYRPSTVRQFIKDTFRLKARRYLGHNPAGGAMVVILIISLLITSLGGLLLWGIEEHAGPFAYLFSADPGIWGKVVEETHEFFANFTLLLVVVHIAGVIIESLIHRENLIAAMVSGLKANRFDSPTQE